MKIIYNKYDSKVRILNSCQYYMETYIFQAFIIFSHHREIGRTFTALYFYFIYLFVYLFICLFVYLFIFCIAAVAVCGLFYVLKES